MNLNYSGQNKERRTPAISTAIRNDIFPASRLKTIISGGQTGADRAGLDVAVQFSFPYGGWCPKGRKAEDGPIGGQYLLTETPTANYLQRTEWNVRDSDATIVFTFSLEATGGSARTLKFARKHGKPFLHLSRGSYQSALILQKFVRDHAIRTVNIAGTRESKEPGIYHWTRQLIVEAFFWSEAHPAKLGGPDEG